MAIKLKGMSELRKHLQKCSSLESVKTVVRKNADDLNKEMKIQASARGVFVKGYTVGDTRDSINTEIDDDGLSASVGATTEYAMYVEYGTRFMEAEPFCKTAFDKINPKFQKDLKKLVR